MNLKKNLIVSLVTSVLLIINVLPAAASPSSTENVEKVVINNTILYSDEHLIKQALSGEELNNPKTKTTVFKNEQLSVVELNKTLSETYENGELVHKNGMIVLDVSLDTSEITTQEEMDEVIEQAFTTEGTLTSQYMNQISPVSTNNNISTLAINSGNVAAEKNDPSYTVHFRYNAYYDIYTKDNLLYLKIKYVNYIATLLDSTFSLTEIDAEVGHYGPGYFEKSNGTFEVGYQQIEKPYVVSNPVSGRTYKFTTNNTFYAQNPAQTNGSSMVSAKATLKFKRNATGTVYSLTMPDLIARQ